MRANSLPSLLVLGQFVASCACLGDDGSARRYALLTRHPEPSLTFCLSGRADVQRELRLTAEQVAAIKHICRAGAKEITGLTELITKARKAQSAPTLAAPDRQRLSKA